MLFQIDVRTILFALFVGNLVSALLVWAYAWGQERMPSHRAFFVGKLLQSLAWLLLGMRGVIPDVLSIVVANPLIFFGFAMESFAVIRAGRNDAPWLFKGYSTAGLLIGVVFLMIHSMDSSTRITYASLASTILFLGPAVALVTVRPWSRLKVALATLYGVSAMGLLIRGVGAAMSQTELALFTPSIFQTVSFLPTYLLMLLGSVGYLLLVKEQSDQELLRAATRDELTGLLNRKALLEQADNLLSLSMRRNEPVSLLMMDLDHFKRVNDTFGHQTGDRVLKDFARCIGELLRRYDVFGRYGGEEFVVFLPTTGAVEARFAAERLRAAVEARQLSTANGKSIPYTVSIGICTSDPEAPTNMGELLRAGDQALYIAKDLGRNCIAQCGVDKLQPLV